MPDILVSTPSNSADPQGDLLNKFLASDTPSTAQQQVRENGGVAIEDSKPEPVPTPDPVPAPPQATKVEAPKPQDKPVSKDAESEVPQDILRKQKIDLGDEPPAPAPQSAETQEPIPPEVAQRGKKGVDAWTAAKREAKQFKQQAEELSAKLKEMETNSASSKDLEEIKARYEESEKNRIALEERVGQLDIAYSSQFKETYDKPISSVFSKSVKLLMNEGLDQTAARDIVTRAMAPNNTPDQIQEIVQDFPVAIQGALYQNSLEMIEGQKRRMSALKDWKASKAALAEQAEREEEARVSEIISENVDSAIDTIRNEGSWLYHTSDTDEAWNEKVGERVNAVKGILKTATPDILAKYVADGIVSRTYRQLYEKQLAISNKLKRELQMSASTRPGLGGRELADISSGVDSSKPVKADDWLSENL